MLTGGQLAALIVAVFWAVLVSFLALTLLKLARLLNEAGKVVSDFADQAGPLMEDMNRTVRRANEQLGRTDLITKQVQGVTQNVSAVTTIMTSVMGGPVVKAAAFTYGVRKALGNRAEDGHGADGASRPQIQARPAAKPRPTAKPGLTGKPRPTGKGRRG